jgi:CRP/FNR family transcriptional regulator, anaerobic regulatory protein
MLINARRLSPACADDGDEAHFCSTCAFSQACMSQGYDKSALKELHVLVEHTSARSMRAMSSSGKAMSSTPSPRCAAVR